MNGCPVPHLDNQSGISKSSGGRAYQNTNDMYSGGWTHKDKGLAVDPGFGDVGGASRYFKQVKGEGMGIPQELIDYLYDMIAPTHLDDCSVLYVPDFSAFQWEEIEDSSLHGMIAVTPSEGKLELWMDHIWRVLKPGAHVLLIAPEDQPAGYTGACLMEDKGFEVRDAILLVQEAGRLHYIPKPAQAERHAGCETLAKHRGTLFNIKEGLDEEVLEPLRETLLDILSEEKVAEILEGDAPIQENQIPEEFSKLFIKQSQGSRGNIHPTCKAKDLMVALLQDIPEGGVVVDPFLGSGTTGLACLETGHDFIGIEKEGEYLQIAEARIRHWDRQRLGDGAEIKSEAPQVQISEDGVDMGDFFGF